MQGDVTHENYMTPTPTASPQSAGADKSFRLTLSPSRGCRWFPDAASKEKGSTTPLKEHETGSYFHSGASGTSTNCSLAESKGNLTSTLNRRVGLSLLRLQLLSTHDTGTSQHVLGPGTEPLVNSLRANLFMTAVI